MAAGGNTVLRCPVRAVRQHGVALTSVVSMVVGGIGPVCVVVVTGDMLFCVVLCDGIYCWRSRRPMFDLGIKHNPVGQVNDGWTVWPKRVVLLLPGQQEV